jgi:hypothetical protein
MATRMVDGFEDAITSFGKQAMQLELIDYHRAREKGHMLCMISLHFCLSLHDVISVLT